MSLCGEMAALDDFKQLCVGRKFKNGARLAILWSSKKGSLEIAFLEAGQPLDLRKVCAVLFLLGSAHMDIAFLCSEVLACVHACSWLLVYCVCPGFKLDMTDERLGAFLAYQICSRLYADGMVHASPTSSRNEADQQAATCAGSAKQANSVCCIMPSALRGVAGRKCCCS